NITNEDDLHKLDNLLTKDLDNNFVDIVINNSIIINNKEVRNKLQDIAKNKKATTIKQVDDITVRDTIKDIALDDIGIDVSVEDLMREYVKNQEFEGIDEKT